VHCRSRSACFVLFNICTDRLVGVDETYPGSQPFMVYNVVLGIMASSMVHREDSFNNKSPVYMIRIVRLNNWIINMRYASVIMGTPAAQIARNADNKQNLLVQILENVKLQLVNV
jgi:hypothetical protein